MELKQIEKRLSWLDEQRRKDNEKLSRLIKKVSATEENLTKRSQQLNEISSEVARLTGLATRIHHMDDALIKQRKEISRQLGEAEDQRTKKEKIIEELHKTDHKALAAQMDELRGVMEDIPQEFEKRILEETRITRSINALEKLLEELSEKDEGRERDIITLEEEIKRDGRRMSELEAATSDVHIKLDNFYGQMDSNEDRIRRLEGQISELSVSETERLEMQNLWIEQQKLKLAEFERDWREWERRFEKFEKGASDIDERMLSFEETYRALKKVRNDLDKLFERLERRINEITEMQRLAEDRLKQEWSGFQADDQKRWNTFKMTTDERWREHSRLHEKLVSQLQILEENATDALRMVSEIKEKDQQLKLEILSSLREWTEEVE